MKNKQEVPIRITARVTIEIEETVLPGVPVRKWLEPMLLKVAPAFHSPAQAEPPPPKPVPVPPPPEPVPMPPRPEPAPVPPREEETILLDTKQVAKLLCIGERTLWSYSRSGRIPKPIRIGNTVRWSAGEIRSWVEAGCPHEDKWEKMKR